MLMNDAPAIDPVLILREIEDSCRACSATIPQQLAESATQWSGIAFRIGRDTLLAPLDEIAEILDMPPLTRIPLAQSWVRGIANIRGNLLLVIDLNGFLGRMVTNPSDKTRILVIHHEGMCSGLVVDEVYGLKHFMESELTEVHHEVDNSTRHFIRRAYRRDEQVWHEVALAAIAATPQFLKAAG